MTNEERDKVIRILQWLHNNKFLFRSTEEDVKYATKLAIQELSQESKSEKVIKMRDATPEERDSIDKYIKSISKPTGVDFGGLKQEPCEDCISRKTLLNKIKEVCFSIEQEWVDFRISQGSNGQRDFLINYIKQLPPVNPQEKIGYWIEGGYDDYKWVCSECGYPRYEYYEKPKAKYCECCGCLMEIER